MALNNNSFEKVFEFVETCEKLTDVDGVLAAVKEIAEPFGFSSFIITGLPLPNRPLDPLVLGSSWPAEWSERYLSQDYFHIDPIGQHAFTTSTPFRWSAVPYRKDVKRAQQMMAEAIEFGLKDGLLVPIFTASGWQSAISYASAYSLDLGPKEIAAAHLLAITAHGRLRTLLGDEHIARQKLTPREREVLTWAAAGKSAWEASAILGVSEVTVISHLNNVRRKLNVANTTQAVVVALQTGELQPY
jgi:LuxR family transcriptional regulator, quorum-sensing system regulator BjaR1